MMVRTPFEPVVTFLRYGVEGQALVSGYVAAPLQ